MTTDATSYGRILSELTPVYELGEQLGAGGTSLVFKARQRSLGRDVVVKLLRSDIELDRARFELEARLLSRLRHPGILELLDFGTAAGCPYIVLPFDGGRPLDELLSERGFSVAEAVALLRTLLDALVAVHDSGIVHRDVKPANILVDPRGVPKLIDFGIGRTRDAEGMTAAGTFVGTPSHAAPEQVLGEIPGPAADLYALGIVAFELLLGQNPFLAQAEEETQARHLNLRPEELPALPDALPPKARNLVLRLLEKAPDRRPTAREALAVLEATEARRGTPSRRSSTRMDLPMRQQPTGAGRPIPIAQREADGRSGRFRAMAGIALGVAALGLLFAAREWRDSGISPVTPPIAPVAPRPVSHESPKRERAADPIPGMLEALGQLADRIHRTSPRESRDIGLERSLGSQLATVALLAQAIDRLSLLIRIGDEARLEAVRWLPIAVIGERILGKLDRVSAELLGRLSEPMERLRRLLLVPGAHAGRRYAALTMGSTLDLVLPGPRSRYAKRAEALEQAADCLADPSIGFSRPTERIYYQLEALSGAARAWSASLTPLLDLPAKSEGLRRARRKMLELAPLLAAAARGARQLDLGESRSVCWMYGNVAELLELGEPDPARRRELIGLGDLLHARIPWNTLRGGKAEDLQNDARRIARAAAQDGIGLKAIQAPAR